MIGLKILLTVLITGVIGLMLFVSFFHLFGKHIRNMKRMEKQNAYLKRHSVVPTYRNMGFFSLIGVLALIGLIVLLWMY